MNNQNRAFKEIKGIAYFDPDTLKEMQKDLVLKKQTELAAIIKRKYRGVANLNIGSAIKDNPKISSLRPFD